MARIGEIARLHVCNDRERDLLFVLEPWGNVHIVPPGKSFFVVGKGPSPGGFDLRVGDGRMQRRML